MDPTSAEPSSSSNYVPPITRLAFHPQLFPAVVARFLTDADISSSMLVSKPFNSILTSHDTFWRYICHRTYRLPAYKPPKLIALESFKSWKEYWYTRPRVHTHGFYAVKISYIPSKREIPPGHIEIGSQLPALKLGEIRLVTYYRYFWFQPDGNVRHVCSPAPPHVVKKNPMGLFPLSTSRQCCGRGVNLGTYSVRNKNQIHLMIPDIGPRSDIHVELKIAYRKGAYGPRYDGDGALKPLPPRGSFFMLLPISFNLHNPAYDGRVLKTPMPITFGEVFHFHSCALVEDGKGAKGSKGERKVTHTKQSRNGEEKMSQVEGINAPISVLLSSEEEKAAFREASL